MAELVVTARGAGSAPARHMDWAVFSRVVDILERDRERAVVVRCDGPVPPDWARMTERLAAGKFRVSLYVGDGRDVDRAHEEFDYVFDARALISRPVARGRSGRAVLKRCPTANLFLGFVSGRLPEQGLLRLLSAHPQIKHVLLGVGWSDWASGPGPDARRLAAARSADIIALISRLTDRGIQCGMGCGLTLCVFSRAQLGQLVGMKVGWPLAVCQPQFCVEPDGTVGYCRRIRQPAASLLEVGSALKIRERFVPLQMMADLCPKAQAVPCRSGLTKACGRGCLADALAAWRGSGSARG